MTELAALESREPVTVDGETIDEITFDCVRVETHESSARITKHPVEDGADITDHIIVEPEVLTLEAIFSNSPLIGPEQKGPQYRVVQRGFGKDLERQGTEGDVEEDRAQTAFDFIYQAHRQGLTFTLSTSMRDYENLALRSIRTPRNAETGHSIHATLIFEKIATADVEQVELAQSDRPTQTRGRQEPSAPAEAGSAVDTKSQSIAASFF